MRTRGWVKVVGGVWLGWWLWLAAGAAGAEEAGLPVRGFCIGAPGPEQVDRFVGFVERGLAPRGVNTLILRVDYGFRFASRPEMGDARGLSVADAKKLVQACRARGIRLIPQINLLGHQSWATQVGRLLRAHPEFDETPWVTMPEKYQWPNPDRLYCKSYCPLHPEVHGVVFALVDEVCDAFEADAFHAGLDEVFYLGEERCPRCGGKDKAELFAGEVRKVRDHLAEKGRKLWMWGDRLLDGATTGLGEWEAALNGTHRAIGMIPKDVMICDWHYDRAEPTAFQFALAGFQVVTCPWKKAGPARQQVADMIRGRVQSNAVVRDRLQGIVQTAWSGATSFMNEYDALIEKGGGVPDKPSEAGCFLATFEALGAGPTR